MSHAVLVLKFSFCLCFVLFWLVPMVWIFLCVYSLMFGFSFIFCRSQDPIEISR